MEVNANQGEGCHWLDQDIGLMQPFFCRTSVYAFACSCALLVCHDHTLISEYCCLAVRTSVSLAVCVCAVCVRALIM